MAVKRQATTQMKLGIVRRVGERRSLEATSSYMACGILPTSGVVQLVRRRPGTLEASEAARRAGHHREAGSDIGAAQRTAS